MTDARGDQHRGECRGARAIGGGGGGSQQPAEAFLAGADHFEHDGLFDLGNIRTQSLQEIWNGEPTRSLRRAHRDADLDRVKLCAKCTDKEGYKVRSLFYPLDRLRRTYRERR
jgi:hypothetical protein